MTYLGIDIVGAHDLVAQLRRTATAIDAPVSVLTGAAVLSEVRAGDAMLLLDQVETEVALAAALIDDAIEQLVAYSLRMQPAQDPIPQPTTGPDHSLAAPVALVSERHPVWEPATPAPALWNAHAYMAWNDVRQESSHNTYAVSGGIGAQFLHGVRSFELDIHRGAPTDLSPSPSWLSFANPFVAVAVDGLRHDRGSADDWHVFHDSTDARSEYRTLSEGLRVIAALPAGDPITIFIDNKDRFGGTHTSETLDRLVRTHLGDRVYEPGDLLARAPGAVHVQQAVSVAGWPTVRELEGRVFVVLTGDIAEYQSHAPALFVAPEPVFASASGSPGQTHVARADAVFYNAQFTVGGEGLLRAVQAGGNIVRTYFNPRCGYLVDDELMSVANYRATDLDFTDDDCAPAVPYPPEGTPVPLPSEAPSS